PCGLRGRGRCSCRDRSTLVAGGRCCPRCCRGSPRAPGRCRFRWTLESPFAGATGGAGEVSSGWRDEAVDHPLSAARLELDLELVAFLAHHIAVAELVMEHARADRDIGTRLG